MENSKSKLAEIFRFNKEVQIEPKCYIWWRKKGEDRIRKSYVTEREDDLICVAEDKGEPAKVWLKIDEIEIIKIKELK